MPRLRLPGLRRRSAAPVSRLWRYLQGIFVLAVLSFCLSVFYLIPAPRLMVLDPFGSAYDPLLHLDTAAVSGVPPEIQAAALIAARCELLQRRDLLSPVLAAHLLNVTGHQVFVTAYLGSGGQKHVRRNAVGARVQHIAVSPGVGASLLDAIEDACSRIHVPARVATMHEYEGLHALGVPLHIRIDVVTEATQLKLATQQEMHMMPGAEVGTVGFWANASPAIGCVVTPGQVIERAMWMEQSRGIRIHNSWSPLVHPKPSLVGVMEQGNPACAGMSASVVTQFKTISWSDPAWPSNQGMPSPNDDVADASSVVPLYRSHRIIDPASLTPADLLRRAVMMADYLASIVRPDGKFLYWYYADVDSDAGGYNILRHGGCIYALLSAYQRTQCPVYLQAGKRALDWLLRRSKTSSDATGSTIRFPVEHNEVKLGGSGLALLAFVQYTEVTQDMTYVPQMREYAAFIRHMVDPVSGEPRSYYSEHGYRKRTGTSIYYPGEALLAITRFSMLDTERSAHWLRVGQDIARYLISTRDVGVPAPDLAHDHWLMIGLSYLHRLAPDDMYVTHVRKLVVAIESKHRGPQHPMVQKHADYLGSHYDPPHSTPSSTRVEGLVAAMDLARLIQDDELFHRALRLAQDTLAFALALQYTPDTVYHLPAPAAVLGAIRGGLLSQEVRNDYVQHALSATLGMERQLVWSQQQQRLPGGAVWLLDPQETAAQQPVLHDTLFPLHGYPTGHHIAWDPACVSPDFQVPAQ